MTTRHPYAGDLLARYAKAEDMLRYRTRSLVTAPEVRPTWLPGTETFWYRNRTATGHEFVLVDAEARTRRPAFDHARVARALGTVLDSTPDPADLPFLEIDLRGDRLLVTVAGRRITVDLLTGQAEDLGPAHAGEAASPDGRWAVGRQGHDLYLRDLETDQVRRLTTDGERDHGYGTPPDATASSVMQENLDITMPPLVSWAPDSTRFVTHRLDQRDLELMHLVRSVPLDGGRPQLMTYRYSVVGDEPLATAEYYVGDVTAGELSRVDGDPVLMDYVSAIALGLVWWSESGDRAYWLTNVRDGTCASLHELDPDTGAVRLLVEESADTHVLHGPQLYDRNVHVLAGGEVLWWSERTGWGHLYLYRPDGSVDAVTSGDWLVRRVVLVDQERRRVVFTAAGREPGSDLYVQQLYSVSLDGGEVTRITADDLDHDARADRSRSYFVDVASRVDVPAISVLRDRDGAVVLELERADATRLYAAGWTAPERVVGKAADGETDIYCSIFRPHDLDETGSYPILDEIYPGPQISTSPMRFPGSGGVMVAERHAASFAALGFVVVTVDGRGTAARAALPGPRPARRTRRLRRGPCRRDHAAGADPALDGREPGRHLRPLRRRLRLDPLPAAGAGLLQGRGLLRRRPHQRLVPRVVGRAVLRAGRWLRLRRPCQLRAGRSSARQAAADPRRHGRQRDPAPVAGTGGRADRGGQGLRPADRAQRRPLDGPPAALLVPPAVGLPRRARDG